MDIDIYTTRLRLITYGFLIYMQIGNAWIDASTGTQGGYDYLWTHALNSDETNAGINKYCDFVTFNISSTCDQYLSQSDDEVGEIDPYDIYAPLCNSESKPAASTGSVSL